MIKITLVSPTDCGHCAEIREILDGLKKDYSSLHIEEVDAGSEEGQDLIIKHGIMQGPGVLINDEFFSMGAISESELRKKFDQLK